MLCCCSPPANPIPSNLLRLKAGKMQSFPLSHFRRALLLSLHIPKGTLLILSKRSHSHGGVPSWVAGAGKGWAGQECGQSWECCWCCWDYAMATAPSRLQLSLMWKISASISKQASPRAALKSCLIETQPSHKIQLIILVRPEGCVHTSIIWRAAKEFRFPSDCENRGNSSAEKGFQWFWCQIRADFIKSRSSELPEAFEAVEQEGKGFTCSSQRWHTVMTLSQCKYAKIN